MKEYKLSAKSKYSVLYLLSGLFMFFFMFAILSLNSHASAVSDYVLNITSSNGTFFETSGLYHSFSGSLQHPEYAYPITTVSGSSSFTRPSNVESVNLEVHVVTSKGDFVVDTHQGTGSYESFSSVKLEGYPIGYYGVCKGYLKDGTTSTTMTMNVSCSASVSNQSTNVTNSLSSIQSTSNQIMQTLNDLDLDGSHDFYSGYNFVTLVTDCILPSQYGGGTLESGSNYDFYFENYSLATLYSFTPLFLRTGDCTEFFVTFRYYGDSLSSFSARFVDQDLSNMQYTVYTYDNSNVFFIDSKGGYKTYGLRIFLTNSPKSTSMCFFEFLSASNPGNSFTKLSVSLMQRVNTVTDIMGYLQQNYDNISPSVTDTNLNISQSVSDISTAQSFESLAFDNFNSQFSQSGLDSFSMSFASTPLLWVSSVITTFYNNMPSTFQYLLMFVAFVGILCTVLNVFGRVAQRFGGGDSPTKLNSKDVFSKIEKNGSI